MALQENTCQHFSNENENRREAANPFQFKGFEREIKLILLFGITCDTDVASIALRTSMCVKIMCLSNGWSKSK